MFLRSEIMITYIKGRLAYKSEQYCIIETGGIGYQILMSESNLFNLPTSQDEVQVFTYLQSREDGLFLYGFLSMDELELFKKLIMVNGIGPKGALGILGTLSGDQLITAILSEDIKALSQAPGIGKKTASRMILDLKDKIDMRSLLHDLSAPSKEGENMRIGESGVNLEEALEVLIALGYSRSDAYQAVSKVDQSQQDIQKVIKDALKLLSQ